MAVTLHVDAHFVRGRDHNVCEDYALALPRAVVLCDGCSGSRHSDVGARLVAHAAAAAPDVAARGDLAWLEPAERAQQALNLPSSALDATCAVAVADDDGIDVALFGDGVVLARRTCGAVEVHEVIYGSGAPAYPAYALDAEREARYLATYAASGSTRHTESRLLGGDALPVRPPIAPHESAVRWRFPRANYSAVFLGSDGLAAFVDRVHSPVALDAVLPLLLRIRAPRGAFIKRRLRRLTGRDAAARGWSPSDDVAVAALCWELGL